MGPLGMDFVPDGTCRRARPGLVGYVFLPVTEAMPLDSNAPAMGWGWRAGSARGAVMSGAPKGQVPGVKVTLRIRAAPLVTSRRPAADVEFKMTPSSTGPPPTPVGVPGLYVRVGQEDGKGFALVAADALCRDPRLGRDLPPVAAEVLRNTGRWLRHKCALGVHPPRTSSSEGPRVIAIPLAEDQRTSVVGAARTPPRRLV